MKRFFLLIAFLFSFGLVASDICPNIDPAVQERILDSVKRQAESHRQVTDIGRLPEGEHKQRCDCSKLRLIFEEHLRS